MTEILEHEAWFIGRMEPFAGSLIASLSTYSGISFLAFNEADVINSCGETIVPLIDRRWGRIGQFVLCSVGKGTHVRLFASDTQTEIEHIDGAALARKRIVERWNFSLKQDGWTRLGIGLDD